MRSTSPSMLFLVAPLRSAARRFSLAVFVALSLATIVLGKADVGSVTRLRMAVDDFFAPILLVLRTPVHAATDAIAAMHSIAHVHQENETLRQENTELLQWQSVARRLNTENMALRKLLNYEPQGATWFVTARIIGTAGGAFSRNLLIDRGGDEGIARGQAAFTGTGLVGRISEVGSRSSRVLMLTDLNSRIPITIGDTHIRAILAGDNSDRPLVLYLPIHATVKVGDRVVTSGDGGVLPPDVPVGVVASTDDSQVRVEPTTDLAQVDYLRIADFGLSGVLPADKVPPPAPLPSPPKKGHGAGAKPVAAVTATPTADAVKTAPVAPVVAAIAAPVTAKPPRHSRHRRQAATPDASAADPGVGATADAQPAPAAPVTPAD